MNLWQWISLLLTILSIMIAVYYAKKNRKAKQLAYTLTTSLPMVSAVSPEKGYRMSILFSRSGGEEEIIDRVNVQFLRFGNIGTEPIRREDIVRDEPLRIEIAGAKVLDIAIINTVRKSNGLKLSNLTESDLKSMASLDFDFLDFGDGASIRMLTVGEPTDVLLTGSIIGMPQGIRSLSGSGIKEKSLYHRLGCRLAFIFQTVMILLPIFVYRWITSTWENVWLLALPLLAFILPVFIVILFHNAFAPRIDRYFSGELSLPVWFKKLRFPRNI